jgi:hypothetical protein
MLANALRSSGVMNANALCWSRLRSFCAWATAALMKGVDASRTLDDIRSMSYKYKHKVISAEQFRSAIDVQDR